MIPLTRGDSMRILITGSKGLIGSALKLALKILNIDVVGIDIRSDQQDSEHGNILNKELLFHFVDGVDGIVHLAAISRVIDGEKNPDLCWLTNVEGTRNIVEAALLSDMKPWILYASSREVYGHPKSFPVNESAVLDPINIYGKSKHAAEEIIQDACQRGLVTSIVRFSNVFGSVHDYPDRVIPAFCRAAAEGSNIRVDGTNNLFDFTYLEDVIQGILSLIRLLSQESSSLPPVHLTSGVAMSLGQIAKIAQKASHHSIEIIEGTSRSFDVSRFWGDTSRSQEMLNWRACVNAEEGMHRLINQYRIFFDTQQRLFSHALCN
jgi:nucleoside-diphosphate-sugar epimerase